MAFANTKNENKKTGTTTGRPNPHTDTGFSHATPPSGKTHTGGDGNGTKTTKKTVTTTGDDKKGFIPVTARVANWVIGKTIGPWADKHNKKKREEFARKEGLHREYYIGNQYNKDPKSRTLDVMSDTGKDFLKEAGYGPFQDKTPTGGGDGDGQRCPDGTMPPCPPQTTAAPAVTPASTTSTSTWQLYPQDSDYLTGKGYDTGGGVRKGPPPKRGPNPQVPPLLFSRGGGCAIRGTKFKGVK
jgi:hypothetical protein|tara:strand:+ start:924 stop:1649 length:726 start_codon:yes stop_codon:yes gene_type:complete